MWAGDTEGDPGGKIGEGSEVGRRGIAGKGM